MYYSSDLKIFMVFFYFFITSGFLYPSSISF